MMNDFTKPPDALVAAIARDLHSVKASPVPVRMIARIVPLAVMVPLLILLLRGVRPEHKVLGPLLTWGASLSQLGLAILLIWLATRESTPGRRLPSSVVYGIAAATALVVVASALLTCLAGPIDGPSPVSAWVRGLACGISSTIAGGVLVSLFSWVYRNSLAARPVVAGALYGASAGVAINASWRLVCPVSTPWHTLGAHGTAVIATAVLGALAGRILTARRRSSPDSRN